MSVTVKRANLWRVEISNSPGTLAQTLEPFASGGVNLDVVMGYSYPDKRIAAIEVFPVTTGKSLKAARTAGLSKSNFPCVVVSGQDKPGLGHSVASALADAGINLNFCVAQKLGKQYAGIFSFEAASEADLAVKIIREAIRSLHGRPARSKRPAKKTVSKKTARKKTTRRTRGKSSTSRRR